MTLSNEQFEQLVLSQSIVNQPFTPFARYDSDGDSIEFIAKPDAYYGRRVDGLLTVYYSLNDDEIVGGLIKGVSIVLKKISQNFPGFKVSVVDGKIKLEYLFLSNLWASNPDQPIIIREYKRLADMAEETQVETECPLAV